MNRIRTSKKMTARPNGDPVEHARPIARVAWITLTLLLAFVSAGVVQKYAGLGGVAGYALVMGCAIGLGRCIGARCDAWLTRHFRMVVGGLAVLLIAGFMLLHPFEDGRGPGKSSDRDEGLEMAVTRMVEGKTPYYPENPMAGPLSVLPGGVFLAAPFVALRNVGYQNVFWLLVFVVVCAKWHGSCVPALMLTVISLVASPSALYEFVSGGDMIANGIYTAVALGWCARVWSDVKSAAVWKWSTCLLLGICLASRPNFLLLLPLLGAHLWRVRGLSEAVTVVMAAGMVAVTVILPFYLHDPSGFTPLIARKKLSLADSALPGAGIAMIGVTVAAALCAAAVLKWKNNAGTLTAFFKGCAWVTLCPMIFAVATQSWVSGHLNFDFTRDRFGLMYIFFAVCGWGGTLFARSNPCGATQAV